MGSVGVILWGSWMSVQSVETLQKSQMAMCWKVGGSPKSTGSSTAKHVQKYHSKPSNCFSDNSVWIKLVDQPTSQHCHPCSRALLTNPTRIQLNSKGNDYSGSVTIMSSQLNGHKGKWSETECRQERAFIQTCLTHRSKVVGLPTRCAPKRRLTGQPEVLASLIGKGMLIMPPIRVWSLSTVQLMMVKINGWKRRAGPVKRLNVSHGMIKSNSSDAVWGGQRMNEASSQSAVGQKLFVSLAHGIPSDRKNQAGHALSWELIKHTTLHQRRPPSLSSLLGRFITGPVYGRGQFWLAWSISLSTLKRETFDTASKTPSGIRERRKRSGGQQIAGYYPTWNRRAGPASHYADDDAVLLHLRTRYGVTPDAENTLEHLSVSLISSLRWHVAKETQPVLSESRGFEKDS